MSIELDKDGHHPPPPSVRRRQELNGETAGQASGSSDSAPAPSRPLSPRDSRELENSSQAEQVSRLAERVRSPNQESSEVTSALDGRHHYQHVSHSRQHSHRVRRPDLWASSTPSTPPSSSFAGPSETASRLLSHSHSPSDASPIATLPLFLPSEDSMSPRSMSPVHTLILERPSVSTPPRPTRNVASSASAQFTRAAPTFKVLELKPLDVRPQAFIGRDTGNGQPRRLISTQKARIMSPDREDVALKAFFNRPRPQPYVDLVKRPNKRSKST